MTPELFKKITDSGLGNREDFEATYDIARLLLLRDVPGDFVECGVFAGAQVALMAHAILDWEYQTGVDNLDLTRRVHLFDTFTGIPEAGEFDEELKGKPAGESCCPMDRVQQNMLNWGVPPRLLVYHAGLFEETVTSFEGKIALLRLDGDLYSSTKPCLEHLYPKVSRGGWVIVDDWNLSGCRKAVQETVIPAPVYWRIPTK